MAKVFDYYPGDFYGDVATSLDWLYSRQNNTAATIEANAVNVGYPATSAAGAQAVATSPNFIECGIVSQNDLADFEQTQGESITLVPPGILDLVMDNQVGPDGFPIDYTPIGLPWGYLLAPVLQASAANISDTYSLMHQANPNGATINGVVCPVLAGMTIYGYLFNLQTNLLNYRIDLFSVSDKFYFQSSSIATVAPTSGKYAGVAPVPSQFQSLLVQQGLYGYWSAQVADAGVVIAALYPASVAAPAAGWSGSALPSGWICHSNTGVGYKLTDYFARIYVEGTSEVLQEDNIPIIVQDNYHARCGSSVVPATGRATVHVMCQDPVSGPTLVYTSVSETSAFQSLPLSYVVPTSDPLYVPDPNITISPAIQNRSSIEDCALAIIAFTASGNFKAAARIINEIDAILDDSSLRPSGLTDALAMSYDTYYGQIDQETVRTGATAWVCYAYCVYMQISQDYSPALYLERMLASLLGLQSSASDLTKGLFYEGYGTYGASGFVAGLIESTPTEQNISLYFAFMRAAGVLQTSAVQLLKTNLITSAQATSLNATAASITAAASSISANLVANLYIVPTGSVPGHFAKGASASGLDVREALDASGAWAALFCHAIGDDTQAVECLKFAIENFLITSQQIVKSSSSNNYNQAYQQLTSFSGFMPYADSTGGYSGSPASVSQEGTWGVILALLDLYDLPDLQSYLGASFDGIDSFLTTLITSQRTLRATTDDGSLVAFSLASRALPYQFEVWPAFGATAWFWLVSTNPGTLLTVSNATTSVPYLQIPGGMSQSVSELEGSSSVGSITVTCIDPNCTLKGLAAQDALIGRIVQLKQGFSGMDLGDFTTLHTMQITAAGQDTDGKLTIQLSDVQRFIQGIQIWLCGGPLEYTPGGSTAQQPVGASWFANDYAVSQSNPRYVAGNPIDIVLAVLQNELGVGQDPALQMTNYVLQSLAPIYDSEQDYETLPPPSGWQLYEPGKDATLIYPNSYIDVDNFLTLRDSQFSGVWFDFIVTRPIDGKQFIEEQILKPLGLYLIVGPDGKLSLKSMKPPQDQTPVFAFSAKNVMGIPATERQDVVNLLTFQMDVDQSGTTTSARSYGYQVSYERKAPSRCIAKCTSNRCSRPACALRAAA